MSNSYPIILKLWIEAKIKHLQNRLDLSLSKQESDYINGELFVLKELFKDFHLENVDDKELIYHNDI
jgi:hypothetical protein